ncbi:maleylpyruvate isomerase N-terminal domain-containing protein [Nocardia arthritidis]|nr:maleylpyruvate isomerase N-terminal domain-containing protein [Nocardia arthritidis]
MDGAVLQEIFEAWSDRLGLLTTQEWAAPTRLPGWMVRDLVAHIVPDERGAELLRSSRVESPAVTSAAQILRIYNMPGGYARANADITAEAARQASAVGPERLVAHFTDNAPKLIAELRGLDPNTGVAHPISQLGTVSFGALTQYFLVEATVHLLDLLDAVGGDPVPASALSRTAEILSAVPDPVAFIESATGRSNAAVLPVMR